MQREKFTSRMGFIFVTAACAIGLGNIWLLPYRVGEFGGSVYLLMFIFFYIVMGMPALFCELAVGRGSQQTIITGHKIIRPDKPGWAVHGWMGLIGSYLLIMFYTTVVGFTFAYLWKAITNQIAGLASEEAFSALAANPVTAVGWTWAVLLISFIVCFLGLRKGVERFSKIIMSSFLVLLIILTIRSLTLPGAMEGLGFMFIPRWTEVIEKHGLPRLLHQSLGQAFFSLSVGIGGMQVFGSYLKKDRTIAKDVVPIGFADLTVSLLCLLLILPAAKAFNIDVTLGARLLFVVMPDLLNAMPVTAFWAILLYLCFFFIAISTLFTIFEGLVAGIMDKSGLSRKKSTIINFLALLVLTLPAALSQSGGILSNFKILRVKNTAGKVLLQGDTFAQLFPFLVSDFILPIGATMYMVFCSRKAGWGWDEFIKEVNTGKGWKLPAGWKFYYAYIMPCSAILVWAFGMFWKFIRPLIAG